jgi:hypothetical protein
VIVGGGANVINQYLAAGLVDEIELHIVPILLGAAVLACSTVSAQASDRNRSAPMGDVQVLAARHLLRKLFRHGRPGWPRPLQSRPVGSTRTLPVDWAECLVHVRPGLCGTGSQGMPSCRRG